MLYEIKKEEWETCKLCGKRVKDLAKIYGGSGIYYRQVFKKHIELDHKITLEDYFDNRPNCKCGICNKKTKISCTNGIRWNEYACGRFPGLQKWSEEAKQTRKGKGNPMFNKTPWNFGLTKDNNEIMKKVSEKKLGRKTSEEAKAKQSESAKKRLIHGHTGCKHSEKTKELLRQNTLKMIKEGKFKQNKTKPFLIMKNILVQLNLNFSEEYRLENWAFDFNLTDFSILIEVDGDYFHSNPKIYPNGPKTYTQKINWDRDQKKNDYCKKNKLKLIRFWECDIMNNPNKIKDQILCILKK